MTAAVAARVSGRSDDQRALLGASVAVVAWGLGPLFVRGVDAPSGTIVFWRLLLAQPLMIGFAYACGGRLSLPMLRRAMVPGVLFATSMASGFIAIRTTSVANATLIGALQPALLLLAAPLLFRTPTGRRQVFYAAVALAGIAFVVVGAGGGGGASLGGDAWAVVNLVIWTAYFVRIKQIRDDGVHSPSFIAAVLLVAFVCVAPVTLWLRADVGSIGWKGVALMAAMALVPGLIGHGLMTWSAAHMDIRVASLLGLVSPVISTLGAWLIYSQELRAPQVLGALLVLAGLAGVVWDHRVGRIAAIEVEPVQV